MPTRDVIHEVVKNQEFFQRAAIRLIIKRFQVALVLVYVESEEIVQWINARLDASLSSGMFPNGRRRGSNGCDRRGG